MNTTCPLSQAMIGYELAATARRLSPHTIADYKNTYRKFAAHIKADLPIAAITREQITQFLADQKTVTGKTLLNYHAGLSSLWSWAVSEKIVAANLLHLVDRPKVEQHDIQPLSEENIRAILSALLYSKPYVQPGKKEAKRKLKNADRDTAIVMLFLDTGIRVSELCALTISRVDLRSPNKSISIRHGKGNKDRHIPISPRTSQTIWKYLSTRKTARADEPLFITEKNRPLDRTQVGRFLSKAGTRAGIEGVHPHQFRHTFAIFYLRNGGDIYTLQMILGHTTLDMVRVYLQIAEADVENAHRKASPVDNMHL